MQEEIRILRDIYFQASRSVCSIERLCTRSKDRQLHHMLAPQREEYRQIANAAQRLLKGRGYSSIRKRILPTALELPMSDQRRAERRLHDCSVAMERSVQLLSKQSVDPKISSLSRQLLLTQQAESARFRQFLS